MVFSSVSFIFAFLPAMLISYKLAGLLPASGRIKAQNALLLIGSLIFYAWGGVRYLALLLVLIVINWFCGLRIGAGRHKKAWLLLGIAANLGALGVYKYFNFVVEQIEAVARFFGAGADFTFGLPHIPLPIGISFFTFQILSYLIDLYRGKVSVQKSPARLALYVMMFPQLIAGPIVRYADIEAEINHRTTTPEQEDAGLHRFILGFAKKVLLSNSVASFADLAFATPGLHPVWAWLGIVCYALHLYMDFSSYSDMAIGLGWIFGFHFNENFNYPYVARNVRDYWKRWHLSLSTWFRDYVYFPLGGSRRGNLITCRNLLVIFLLTGLWHGAAWHYVAWGVLQGLFLILERGAFGKLIDRLPRVLQHLYALLAIAVSYAFFRADNIPAAFVYLGELFGLGGGTLQNLTMLKGLTGELVVFGLIAAVISTPVFPKLRSRVKPSGWWNLAYLALLFVSLAFMTGAGYNPFIYFRF